MHGIKKRILPFWFLAGVLAALAYHLAGLRIFIFFIALLFALQEYQHTHSSKRAFLIALVGIVGLFTCSFLIASFIG